MILIWEWIRLISVYTVFIMKKIHLAISFVSLFIILSSFFFLHLSTSNQHFQPLNEVKTAEGNEEMYIENAGQACYACKTRYVFVCWLVFWCVGVKWMTKQSINQSINQPKLATKLTAILLGLSNGRGFSEEKCTEKCIFLIAHPYHLTPISLCFRTNKLFLRLDMPVIFFWDFNLVAVE